MKIDGLNNPFGLVLSDRMIDLKIKSLLLLFRVIGFCIFVGLAFDTFSQVNMGKVSSSPSAAAVVNQTVLANPVFPLRPITVVVPFPPGGTTDVLAREVIKSMQSNFKVPFLVLNKDGASGTLGSEFVSRSVGDPHVLLLTATHHVINPSLLKNIPYDTRKSFTPISLIATAPNVLVANNTFPVNSIAELIRLARERPGEISFASSGIGGANHLSGELLKVMTGIHIEHIPYRGAAPALNDVIAGHVPIMFDGLAAVSKHLAEGRIKAIGITTLKRSPLAPNIPTLNESGVPGFEVSSWFGLYGPSQIPSAIVDKLSQEVQIALNSNEVKEQFLRLGVTPGDMDASTFATFVESEMKKWSQVISNAKIPKQ
jgi:tripartite-type tricarboxylate transporter receptor subunit TctC